MKNDIKNLLVINDMVIAEEIQRILEKSGIYVMLVSDNPASSALEAFSGPHAIENITLKINKDDYAKAVEILSNTSYRDLLANE